MQQSAQLQNQLIASSNYAAQPGVGDSVFPNLGSVTSLLALPSVFSQLSQHEAEINQFPA